jgi:NADH-quinone oxidoreductase subunit F
MRAQPYRVNRRDGSVDAATAAPGRGAAATLPVLQTVQAANEGYLSPKLLGAVADALAVNDARVHGVATFYSLLSTQPRTGKALRVCDGPVCMLQGGGPALMRALLEAAPSAGRDWSVQRCSCLGLCDRAPAVLRDGAPCGPIAPASAGAVLSGPEASGEVPSYPEPLPGEVRAAMARVGRVGPESIDSAVEAGAYQALATALARGPAEVLGAVERSGLRGCGGAGFPTGRKWRMAAAAGGPEKYVIANADESEPGAFKDRVLMEGDPHLLLEGLALAGYAVGAGTGALYVRGEYEWIARRLERALAQTEQRGWLGENIRGSRFSFRIHLHRGAGAYVCGEETALLESLEGKHGQPRSRSPYPTTHGYRGQPTVINNVETLCQVPALFASPPARAAPRPGS